MSSFAPKSPGENTQPDLSGLNTAVSQLQANPNFGRQEIRLSNGSVLTAEICSQLELRKIMAYGNGASACGMKDLEETCIEKLIQGNENCLLVVCDDGRVIIVKKSKNPVSAEQHVGDTRGDLQQALTPAEAAD